MMLNVSKHKCSRYHSTVFWYRVLSGSKRHGCEYHNILIHDGILWNGIFCMTSEDHFCLKSHAALLQYFHHCSFRTSPIKVVFASNTENYTKTHSTNTDSRKLCYNIGWKLCWAHWRTSLQNLVTTIEKQLVMVLKTITFCCAFCKDSCQGYNYVTFHDCVIAIGYYRTQ